MPALLDRLGPAAYSGGQATLKSRGPKLSNEEWAVSSVVVISGAGTMTLYLDDDLGTPYDVWTIGKSAAAGVSLVVGPGHSFTLVAVSARATSPLQVNIFGERRYA